MIAVMAVFPSVIKRVKNWAKEVEKAQYFAKKLDDIEGISQEGQKPHLHDLIRFESPIFHEISQTHSRKGFFLYEELKENKIWGLQPGITKSFKISTYGQSMENLKYCVDIIYDIINKYT
jgi:Sep-tRNA:Cys-tRNA synthetase